MGFFDAFLKLTTDIIVTPLAVIKDIITIGDEKGSATAEKLVDIKEDIDKLIENK